MGSPLPSPPIERSSGTSHIRYWVLAAGCSLAVLTYIHRLGFVVGNSAIKKDLGLNDEDMGYVAMAFLLAYGLFQVPGGMLGDRLGGRHLLTILVLIWSLLAGAVTLTLLFPVGGYWPLAVLLMLRFLFGAVQAGGFPILARVLAEWMPTQERGFAQGLVWTFSRLGGALVPYLFLWLFAVFGGWATPFWLMSALGLVWCGLFWPWFRNRPSEMSQVSAAELALIAAGRRVNRLDSDEPEVPLQATTRRDAVTTHLPLSPLASRPSPLAWWRFLASRNVWALCLMYGFLGFSGNFFTSLYPLYLKDHRHLNADDTALLSALPLAFGIVSCVLSGAVSDWIIRRWGSRRRGRRLTGCIGLALASLTILSTILVDEVWLLGFLFSAAFFFNDSAMGPAWAACADLGKRRAGALSGAMNMCGSVFGAMGAWLAGAFFRRDWDAEVFIIFAGSYALASLCWLAVDVTKPLVPPEKPLSPQAPG